MFRPRADAESGTSGPGLTIRRGSPESPPAGFSSKEGRVEVYKRVDDLKHSDVGPHP